MTLRQYEIFYEIARQLNFARAAESLNMTPSAVSHALALLEEELGFALFLRSRTKVVLTKEGGQLLAHVKQILEHDKALREEAALFCGLEKGEVTIGAFSSVCLEWLPDILQSFSRDYPNIRTFVLQGDYDDVLDWVKEGIVDIGFETLPTDGKLSETPLYTDELLCVVPSDYTPVNGSTITKADLETMPFVIQRSGYDTDTRNYIRKHHLKIREKYRIDDDRAIIAFVEKGLGISLMPRLAIGDVQADIKLYPVTPGQTRVIGLITQNTAALSPAAATMHEYIIKYAAGLA